MGAVESKNSPEVVEWAYYSNFDVFSLVCNLTFLFIYFCWSLSMGLPSDSSTLSTEGLQSELDSSNKEGECVRSKLKAQVEEMERYKQRSEDILDEDSRRYGENFKKNLANILNNKFY